MAESVQEFFDGLAARADAEKTAGMNNSYLFDIEGAGAVGRDGRTTARSTSPRAPARPTRRSPPPRRRFMAIVSGEQNPTTAYMTGKLKIKGDMGAAMKLQKLF